MPSSTSSSSADVDVLGAVENITGVDFYEIVEK